MPKRLVFLGVALVAALSTPSLASAHTGSVKCDSTGVVFDYAANFSHTTQVTENVGGAIRIVTVPAYTATTDTWAGVTGSVTASASWQDGDAAGSIPSTNLTCPAPPPAVCPADTTPEGMSNGVLVCIREKIVTNTVTVEVPAPVLPAVHDVVIRTVKVPAKRGKCPRFTRKLSKAGKPLVCGKDVIRWRTPKPTPIKRPFRGVADVSGGVTG